MGYARGRIVVFFRLQPAAIPPRNGHTVVEVRYTAGIAPLLGQCLVSVAGTRVMTHVYTHVY